jgi:hypothetical protein
MIRFVLLLGLLVTGCSGVMTKDEFSLVLKHSAKSQNEFESMKHLYSDKELAESISQRHKAVMGLLNQIQKDEAENE